LRPGKGRYDWDLSIWDDTLTAAELADLQEQLGSQPTQASADAEVRSTNILIHWDPDVFVGCQCSPALASIYVIGGSGFRVLVWSPTA
jgi:hypothetical protein